MSFDPDEWRQLQLRYDEWQDTPHSKYPPENAARVQAAAVLFQKLLGHDVLRPERFGAGALRFDKADLILRIPAGTKGESAYVPIVVAPAEAEPTPLAVANLLGHLGSVFIFTDLRRLYLFMNHDAVAEAQIPWPNILVEEHELAALRTFQPDRLSGFLYPDLPLRISEPVDDALRGVPVIAIAWDPAVMTEDEYAELVELVGDVARAAGGVGIQRIIGRDVGVMAGEGVAQ